MRYQGKIINWKDDQGFGFVIPNGGGEKAFVHIKAFSSRSRRPVDGDMVTYEQIVDEKRCFRANNLKFVGERVSPPTSYGTSHLGAVFTALYCCFLVLAWLMGRLSFVVLGTYIVASVIAFLAYWIDKSAAQTNHWRTKESTLHLFGLIGGWPGALIAQKTLRHKSKKEEFQSVFWITVVLNCGALGWLFAEDGSIFMRSIIGPAA